MVKLVSKKDDEIPLLERDEAKQLTDRRKRPEVTPNDCNDIETVYHQVQPDDTLEVRSFASGYEIGIKFSDKFRFGNLSFRFRTLLCIILIELTLTFLGDFAALWLY